jgi:hypothetical protein
LKGIQIGQILIQQGVLTDKQVRQILHIQKNTYRPFGDLAERLYGVSAQAIEDAWVTQYLLNAGIVDLEKMSFNSESLTHLNSRQAWQFHMIPTGFAGDHLLIATDRKHLIRAINFSSSWLNHPACFMVAQSQQLQSLLMRHYPVPAYMAEYAQRF